MHSLERLDHHELGAQQSDAVHVARRDLGRALWFGEIDVDARGGDRRRLRGGCDGGAAARRRRVLRARPATTVPALPSTVTTVPVASIRVASCAPTMHGRPSSRATIAACDVMPPASVTIAAARRMIGTQSGDVMCVTRISPACIAPSSAGDSSTRTAPVARPGLAPKPVDEHAR